MMKKEMVEFLHLI